MIARRPAYQALAATAVAMCVAFALTAGAASAEDIVRDGQPRAQIVIAEEPTRSARLAARELQTHIEKISGASLPITTDPDDEMPVRIFVGKSARTEALGLSNEHLERDAFRMVSGDNWLALLGRDRDFVPIEPWSRGVGPAAQARMLEEWDALTGTKWGNPPGQGLGRMYSSSLDLWHYDERGSLNAVHQFLRDLGVEWYMPGELGEVLPTLDTIPLPQADREVHPDFAKRHFMFSRFNVGRGRGHEEEVLWYLRQGLTKNDREMHPHGMRYGPLGRSEMREKHPEFYAMYGGRRGGKSAGGRWQACFSSPELFDEVVRYVRFMFDYYPKPVKVDLTPEDGFGSLCECALCEGKDTPERGRQGVFSDYVWGFINQVAEEVRKTHPDRYVTGYAYGGYLLPPENIELLSPNLRVSFDQTRTIFANPRIHRQYLDARECWIALLAPGENIWTSNHYPYTDRGQGIPAYLTRIIAEDLRSLKGVSVGEFVSPGSERDDPERIGGLDSPGFSHLNIFVTARFHWDAEQDLDALLARYYRDFYGPAAEEMQAFVEYCEANHYGMLKDAERINEALARIAKARDATPPDSVYRARVDLLADYLRPLPDLAEQLARSRENVPEARAHMMPTSFIPDAEVAVDGKLDEPAWQKGAWYSLRELQTGRPPAFPTSFALRWSGEHLYIGIVCREMQAGNLEELLNIGARRDNDSAIWNGDVVEVLLETQGHSYYQLTISPTGALYDMDCAGRMESRWSSQAEVATHIGDDHWSVEIRIPVAPDGHGDPLHQVVGRRPTSDYPWYFNIGRGRMRETGNEFSAFSPTGRLRFPVVEKMARLVAR